MQRQPASPVQAKPERQGERPIRTQPVPLDPKLLQAVSGGLPKGTWSAASTDDDFLPKGTW